jgi:alkylation response protein AidB-like acyl-CoA dehydrogenase
MSPTLAEAEEFLRAEVAPRANVIDRDPEALRVALSGLCERGFMALRRPAAFGGPAWPESDFRAFQEAVARASGCLAFLQTQHQTAVGLIAKGDNAPLKAEVLPLTADGGRLIGIGFSQLRRSGPPMTRAEAVPGGYEVSGHVPWITGESFFGEFIVGATLPDRRSLLALVPLAEGNGVRLSEPMRLAAMDAARTVTADLDRLFVPDDRVVAIKPDGWVRDNDLINIALQGAFAVGCAQAGLDVFAKAVTKRRLSFAEPALARLQAELDDCRAQMRQAQAASADEATTDDKLRLRAWAIDLAARCANAGVAASSGAANSLDHDAQRVYREALVFTVSAQTPAVMQATLDRLAGRG